MSFDIEKFIRELPWSADATDRDKTLVAGNLRSLYSEFTSSGICGCSESVRNPFCTHEFWSDGWRPHGFLLVDGFLKVEPEYYDDGPDGCSMVLPDGATLEIVDDLAVADVVDFVKAANRAIDRRLVKQLEAHCKALCFMCRSKDNKPTFRNGAWRHGTAEDGAVCIADALRGH